MIKLKIFLASRNVISEYYNIQRDELQLNRRTVRAPFNGTYKEVYMEMGAYTNTGGKVARAIRTDEMELEVPLKRVDATWVNIGDPVIIHSEKRALNWKGKVIRKSAYVDENTQSQEIFINIPFDRNKPLLAGEYLLATFPVRPIENVMEIPRNSVFNSNEVFVVNNGRLAKRQINVIKENERTLIFNGLAEGDSVVVQQLINVSEGTMVQIESDAPAPQQMGSGKSDNKKSRKRIMRKIIERFVEYPVYANLIIAMVILAGGVSMLSLKKSFFPETESRLLSVSVYYPGASPVEMEEGVTTRIEEAVRGLIGIKEITSTSLENSCLVSIETTGEYPINEVLQEVKNAVDGISSLPSAAERPIVSKNRSRAGALRLELVPVDEHEVDLMTLKEYAQRIEEDFLNSGVMSQISISGYPQPEISVEIKEAGICFGTTLPLTIL